MSIDVSEEHAGFISRVEEKAKKETRTKQVAKLAASCWCLVWIILQT
jgi:hypothetical protein